uniref:ENY2 transcription and export complex 2 subunit n=1 Tax=Nomascus leucogenys TaxID=61853 RepID=A0A2I3HAF7_NOMLE
WVVSRTMNKGAQMRAPINQKLIETGERERLKELLRAKLIECGWKDQLKARCKEFKKKKKSLRPAWLGMVKPCFY